MSKYFWDVGLSEFFFFGIVVSLFFKDYFSFVRVFREEGGFGELVIVFEEFVRCFFSFFLLSSNLF